MEQEKPDRQTEQIAELGRQIDEARQQVTRQLISAGNLLGNLSAEIKAIGKEQKDHRRGLSFNSVAAYVLFVLLVAGGFYFVHRSRLDRIDFEKNALVREHAAALTRLAGMKQAEEKRKEAESKSYAFYRLTQAAQTQKALVQYQEVAQFPLSRVEAAVFQDWHSRTRNKLAYSAYAAGMKAVGEQQHKRAAAEFRAALEYLPHPPHEASLRYYLGIALMSVGDYKEAAEELERALAVDAEKTVSREIRFHLGSIYEQVARRDKAIKAYEAYLSRYPNTPQARAARRRLKELK